MNRKPDFIIVGAMKCATSTLQKQLSLQNGIFMTTPKEPNFFSDDDIFQRGAEWYSNLYQGAAPSALKGEASTHYTKLPTYPHTVERLANYCGPNLKIIYIIRDPIERLISHYIHEWSQKVINSDLDTALDRFPELVEYSRYHQQISPYIEAFGKSNILILSYERLISHPQEQLEIAAKFIAYPNSVTWQESDSRMNISSERMRKFAGYDLLINSPLLASLRKNLVPVSIRRKIKSFLTMQSRPTMTPSNLDRVRRVLDDDLGKLGHLLGVDLSCDSFHQLAAKPLHAIQ